jgi:hypothetical protein
VERRDESETGWNSEAKVRTEEKRNFLPVYTRGRGADKSLALSRKQQATGLKKMHLLYIFPSEIHALVTSLF